MNHAWIDALGWIATAVFVSSYFFSRPSLLRAVQMLGALLWITYGLLIGASPVIVANALVFSAAAWTVFRAAPPSNRAENPTHTVGPPRI
jgi:hypothetical protein